MPTSILPQFLPWLGLVGLLSLRPNRSGAAWWILAAAACGFFVQIVLGKVFGGLPSDVLGAFVEAANALGFGLAGVWLIAGHLARKHRFLTFLGVLFTLGPFSLITWMIGAGFNLDGGDAMQTGILLGVGSLVIAAALSLAGLLCRRRYRPLRLCLWLLAGLCALWTLALTPLVGMAMISGHVPMVEVGIALLSLVAFSFASLVPFLALSFVNGFYRERLQGLLHLEREGAEPPLITPAPAPAA